MGRPTKYTPETVEKIVEILRGGNTRKSAYTLAGINSDTFCEWLRVYPEFSSACKAAEEDHLAEMVETVKLAAKPRPATKTVTRTYKNKSGDMVTEVTQTVREEVDWKAATWLLERTRPGQWKERKTIEITNLSNEQLMGLIGESADSTADVDADPDTGSDD